MPTLNLNEATKLYYGNTEAKKLYKGNQLLYTPSTTLNLLSLSPSLWLDADDSSTITLVSNSVSEWRDKSGNNRHASQTTTDNRPIMSTLNGKGVLSFDGSNDFLRCENYNYIFQSVFIVFSRNSITNTFDGLLGLRIASSNLVPNSVSNIPLLLNAWDTTSDWFFSSSNLVFNNGLEVPTSSKTSPSASTQRFFNTIVNQFNISYVDYAQSSGTGIKNLCIGADSFTEGGSRYGHGNIAEIIIFSSVLSQATRELLEGYLAWKWGLVNNLPSNHPYKNQKVVLV
jgi:hypothetical protein